MKTVIMAGGRGTRISELFPDIPKPLIPIEGVPVLEREIISLRNQGFKDIIMTVSHMGDKIMNHFGDGAKLGVAIQYYNEVTPLGNAGALFKLREQLGDEPFLLLNADAIFDVDFNRMVRFHQEHGGLVTLFTHPNNHPYDSGLIIAEKDMSVQSWLAKEDVRPTYYKNRVNAGLHVIDPKVLDMVSIDADKIGTVDKTTGKTVKVDLDRQLLKPLAGTGKMFCYDSPEYVKDMGTPDRFHQVEEDFKAGRVAAKNLSNKQKAVFLDRDGSSPYINGAEHTLRIMQQAPVLIFIVNTLATPFNKELSMDERVSEICNAQSIGAAIENMTLEATAQGLGSLWICDSFFAQKELSAWAGGELYAVLAVGYADEAPAARPRKKVEEVVEWRG